MTHDHPPEQGFPIARPDKVLFPKDGIAKQELADYYERVAPFMLPHVRGRPVSMRRYPDGIGGFSFVQKDVPGDLPSWVRTETVEKKGGTLRQIVIENADTLRYLANQACIAPHVWLSRIERPDRPDRLVIDFDPAEEGDTHIRQVVRTAAGLLQDLGLAPFVMTTGSRGYHLHVPLDAQMGFDEVRAFARDFARLLVAWDPGRLTIEVRKNKRRGRIFVDVLRNAYAQTSVAPYAVRARDGAPVATPLDLAELGRAELHPRRYTLRNLFRRLGRKDDPWAKIFSSARSLVTPRRELEGLLAAERERGREAA